MAESKTKVRVKGIDPEELKLENWVPQERLHLHDENKNDKDKQEEIRKKE